MCVLLSLSMCVCVCMRVCKNVCVSVGRDEKVTVPSSLFGSVSVCVCGESVFSSRQTGHCVRADLNCFTRIECVYICVSMCVCEFLCVCMYVYVCVCVFVYARECGSVSMCMSACVCICV